MKKYIDADDFLDLFYVASAGQDKAFVEVVEMVVEDTPAADVVEVVRCKDCKWYRLYHLACVRPHCNGIMGVDDFCSRGERKDA